MAPKVVMLKRPASAAAGSPGPHVVHRMRLDGQLRDQSGQKSPSIPSGVPPAAADIVMRGGKFNDTTRYPWYSITVKDKQLLQNLRVSLVSQRLRNVKSAIDWSSLCFGHGGFIVRWKKDPVKYRGGYRYWVLHMDNLGASKEQWAVTGHMSCPEGYVLVECQAETAMATASAEAQGIPAVPAVSTPAVCFLATPKPATPAACALSASASSPPGVDMGETRWPCCKVSKLVLSLQNEPGLGLPASVYVNGTILGKGSYGCVRRVKHGPFDFAVKSFEKLFDALAEASIMDKLSTVASPHVVQLLDCSSTSPKNILLVYAYAGSSLRSIIDPPKSAIVASAVKTVFAQCCFGLKALHDLGIYHSDLKPENILVQREESTSSSWHARIADLGGAVEVGRGTRVVELPWCRTTMWFRAPELLTKVPHRGSGKSWLRADIWAMGAVLSQMVRLEWHMLRPLSGDEEKDSNTMLLRLRRSFPRRGSTDDSRKFEFSPSFYDRLGCTAVDLLDQMLNWSADLRCSVDQCLAHDFLVGDVMRGLVGCPSIIPGARHDWCIRMGHLCPSMLAWLRKDVGSPAQFTAAAHRTDEPHRKWIVSGKMVAQPGSKALNAMCIKDFLPLPRLRAWLQAWKEHNEHALAGVVGSMHNVLASADDLRDNFEHALNTDWSSWLLVAGQIHVFSNPGADLVEPPHFDGAASFLHMGITLFGRRVLRLWTGARGHASAEQMEVEMVPGSVYIGTLTGAEHQVQHLRARASHELCEDFAITVMIRTTLFPYNQARVMAHLPQPESLYIAMAKAAGFALSSQTWSLPTLAMADEHFVAQKA